MSDTTLTELRYAYRVYLDATVALVAAGRAADDAKARFDAALVTRGTAGKELNTARVRFNDALAAHAGAVAGMDAGSGGEDAG